MNPNNQITMISKAMRNGMNQHSLTDPDWQRTLGKLQMLLARLIDPQDMDVFVYGEVGRPAETNLVVLLVTTTSIYHADFEIRETKHGVPGWEIAGNYNLRVVPRSAISEIVVDEIGTADIGLAEEVLRADYTVHAHDFSFSIPLGAQERNKRRELELLDSLHSDLAQK